MQKYLPLKIAEYVMDTYAGEGIIGSLAEKKLVNENANLKSFMHFLFGNDFLSERYSGEFSQVNKFMLTPSFLSAVLKDIPEEVYRTPDIKHVKTEVKDVFGIPAVVEYWSKHKMVYKLDNDFFDELYKTKGIVITKDALKHLPFDAFYIDLESCKGLHPIVGAFVYVMDSVENPQIVVYMETNDAVTFSYYSQFSFDENGLYEVPGKQLLPESKFMSVDITPGKKHPPVLRSLENDRRTEITLGIMQILMFLACDSKDVSENEGTKRTYKPSSTIRNKFSEIRMWDVGMRYGKAIRISKHEAVDVCDTDTLEKGMQEREDATGNKTAKVRKSPRPHVRAAHWQRYWVGHGRNTARINWVPPTFILGNKDVPATIRLIKY